MYCCVRVRRPSYQDHHLPIDIEMLQQWRDPSVDPETPDTHLGQQSKPSGDWRGLVGGGGGGGGGRLRIKEEEEEQEEEEEEEEEGSYRHCVCASSFKGDSFTLSLALRLALSLSLSPSPCFNLKRDFTTSVRPL